MWNMVKISFQKSFSGASVVRILRRAWPLVIHILTGHFKLVGRNPASFIYTTLTLIHHPRPERPLNCIIFSRPNDLNRRLDFFRNECSLLRIIEKCFSAKATTKESHVHGNFFFWQSQCFNEVILNPAWCLYWSPDLRRILLYMGDTVKWLHAAVGLVGRLIHRLNFFCRLRQSIADISFCSV